MRVSRTIYANDKTPYLVSAAVTIAELVKFIGSALLVIRDMNYSLVDAFEAMKLEIFRNPIGTLKVGVPAVLYTIQNNLLFISLSNISGAVYQITYQLKILTTAILSVIILHREVSIDRWFSLFLLTAGVIIIQVPSENFNKKPIGGGDPFVGIIAVLAACITSGLAGVYLEKVLKGTKTSIWLRNMQLALLSGILAFFGAYWTDGQSIKTNGFFQGFNGATWLAIAIQSAGGLIVAVVLKYADNILKCFGSALAIVLSCLVSYYVVKDYNPTWLFVIGALCVCISTYTYGVDYPIIFYVARPKLILKNMLRKFYKRKSTNDHDQNV